MSCCWGQKTETKHTNSERVKFYMSELIFHAKNSKSNSDKKLFQINNWHRLISVTLLNCRDSKWRMDMPAAVITGHLKRIQNVVIGEDIN